MKQKIVIRVCMCCEKCRSKAMALAAATCGVDSVELDGKYRDEVVVVGEGVDSVKLTRALRKKVGHADLLHVSEVGIKKDNKKPSDTAAPSNPPPSANPPPPSNPPTPPTTAPPNPPPPPQQVTFVCHHCHPVCYGYYSCYCYCHRH